MQLKKLVTADLAQLVRALVCGTRCREFESHNPPHLKSSHVLGSFFSWANADLLESKSDETILARKVCVFFVKNTH